MTLLIFLLYIFIFIDCCFFLPSVLDCFECKWKNTRDVKSIIL